MPENEKAVILLSGGLDSTTCMAVAKSKGYDLYPISFNYHQRHSIELEGAKKIARFFGAKRHLIIETNMDAIGGSALTDESIDVPNGDVERSAHDDVPPTYVPARNLIFLSYAMGYAEVIGADHVYIGVNSVDYSGHPKVPITCRLCDDRYRCTRKAHKDRDSASESNQERYCITR